MYAYNNAYYTCTTAQASKSYVTLIHGCTKEMRVHVLLRNEEYKNSGGGTVTVSRLEEWVGPSDAKRISNNWGGRLDKAGIRTAGVCLCARARM